MEIQTARAAERRGRAGADPPKARTLSLVGLRCSCVDAVQKFTRGRFVPLALIGGKQKLALSFLTVCENRAPAVIVCSLVFVQAGYYRG